MGQWETMACRGPKGERRGWERPWPEEGPGEPLPESKLFTLSKGNCWSEVSRIPMKLLKASSFPCVSESVCKTFLFDETLAGAKPNGFVAWHWPPSPDCPTHPPLSCLVSC